jgi:hypothetical protein
VVGFHLAELLVNESFDIILIDLDKKGVKMLRIKYLCANLTQ